MCASLAARKDPAEELKVAVSLINRVTDAAMGVRVGVHVCRGNWSRGETTLLRGGYQPSSVMPLGGGSPAGGRRSSTGSTASRCNGAGLPGVDDRNIEPLKNVGCSASQSWRAAPG